MPAVWERTIRLTQTLWKRVAREFCDGCGMSICDDYFFRWAVLVYENPQVDSSMVLSSHMQTDCIGAVVSSLMKTMGSSEAEQ
jgi:hypothetical protein